MTKQILTLCALLILFAFVSQIQRDIGIFLFWMIGALTSADYIGKLIWGDKWLK